MKLLLTTIIVFTSVQTLIAAPTVAHVRSQIIKTCREERFTAPLMLAICERESNFGLALDHNQAGDNGHGRGVFQIDDRYHRKWLQTHDWRDTAVSCRYAIKLLRSNLRHFKWHVQKAVAAYNCGCGNIPDRGDWDRNTTGKNYSRDVFRRATRLGKSL